MGFWLIKAFAISHLFFKTSKFIPVLCVIKFQVIDCVMQLRFPILVIFLCSLKILNVFGKCRPSTYSISGFHLSGHVMSTKTVLSLSECLNTCVTKIRCKSLNFCSKENSCILNDARRHAHPEDYGTKAGCIYMDVFESPKVCPFNISPMLKFIF